MKGLLLRWLVLAVAVALTSWMLEGIKTDGLWPTVLAAAILGILNAFLRPLLIILTLPLNVVTLGLFTFIINAFLLKITADLVPGFSIAGFLNALWGGLIITAVSWILNRFIDSSGGIDRNGIVDLKKRGERWE